MARMARVVVPEYPHHVTQRGVRSMNVFFSDEDRLEYLRLMKEQCDRFGLHVLSYCLMDNHVHFVVVPEREESLARAIGEAHRLYTRMVNFRDGVRGFPVPGPVFFLPAGREISTGLHPLCGAQSGPRGGGHQARLGLSAGRAPATVWARRMSTPWSSAWIRKPNIPGCSRRLELASSSHEGRGRGRCPDPA